MDIAKPVDIKDQPTVRRRYRVWIVLSVLAGLFLLGEIAFQSLKSKGSTDYTNTTMSASAVAIDGQGRSWVGTYDGLSVLDPEAAIHLGYLATLHSFLSRIAVPVIIILAIV